MSGPDTLVERLRHTYAAWNNPPSDGLPEGASIVLEAAAELSALREQCETAERDIETFWKPQFDEQCLRAEAAEAALENTREALLQSLELAKLARKLTGCRGDDDYVWAIQAKIEAALASLPATPPGKAL